MNRALLIVAIGWLILTMVSIVWADELEEHYADKEQEQKEKKQTFEEIVADTFTFEEFAEWTAIRQKDEARANKEREQQLACVAKGTNPKTCVDPHWCLYPNKLNTDECIWYRTKYKL